MTQEDQLENSHQPSKSVHDQVNDDSKRKLNSKNTTIKINIRNANQRRKNLNNNSVNNCVLKSNMGAAIAVRSEQNKSTIASSLPSSSPASSISPSSSDQLALLSAVKSSENDKNKDHLENDNKTVQNVETATALNDTIPIAITNVEVHQQHQQHKQHQQHQQQQQSLVDTSKLLNANCDSVNVINNNNSKMTVIKSQNSGENIREIIQMKIDDSDKINNDNNASTTEENQKSSENTGNSENENKLNEVEQNVKQDEENLNDIKNNLLVIEDKTKYSGSEIVTENNKKIDEVKKISIETENLKNKNDKVASVDGAVVKNLSVDGDIKSNKELKRRSKERSISQDIEDPLARLKALKANISNALREVKAVLSEHGEPVTPEKPEKSTDEIKNNSTDSGVVNFRFVKKIRRRSTFEEDKNAITEIIVNQIVDNKEKMDKNEKDQSQIDVKINEKIEQLPQSSQKMQQDKSNKNVSVLQSEDVVSVKSESKDEKKNMKNKIENENEQTKQNVVTVEIQNVNEESEQSNKKITKKISPKVKKIKDNESTTKTDKNEEKKLTKNGTKKLVKRNSQDGAIKNSTSDTNTEEISKQQSESKKSDESNALAKTVTANGDQSISDTVSSADGDNKKKIVKKVSNGKKSVKTPDSKTASERRASIATAQASEEVIIKSPVLEKRRSSTSRLVIKKKQTKDLENTQTKELNDLKKSENIPVKPKISTISSSESKTETVLDKIKTEQEAIIPAKENKVNNESMKEITSFEKTMNKSNEKIITSRNSLSSITESEKENIAPHAEADDSAKKTTQIAATLTSTTATVSKVEEKNSPTPSVIIESKSIGAPKSIQSNVAVKTEPTKISFEKSENVIQKPSQNEKPASEIVLNQATKVEDNSSQVVNKQPSLTSKVVATTAATTTTIATIAATIQTEKSTEKALSSNLTSTVSSANIIPAVNEASKSLSNVATQLPSIDPSQAEPTNCPEKDLKTSESIEASLSSVDDPQANSKSPLVRNEITEKLAGLKPKPFKMPVVMKSNLEMNKIHPVMVLHMTPPKNSSVTTFQKLPQKGTLDEIAAENTENVIHKNSSDGRKRKMKKVVIRRMKRRLSLDTSEDKPSETEIEEKEIASKIPGIEEGSETEKISSKKSCLKMRVYEPGETVMYADRVKKIMKWRKAIVLDKITSISYKLDVEGEEKPAHISYIKKYTDKKVHFGGKEYLEIDYAQDDEDDDDEEEEKYNIWARV